MARTLSFVKMSGAGNDFIVVDNREGVVAEPSKAELARSLGTISETLSRNLRKMRELDLIRVRGKEIAILDPARLQALADGERI